MIGVYEELSNLEKERRFYGDRSQEVVANPVGCADPVLAPLASQVEEKEQARGMMVKRYVYDPKKGYKVKREVWDAAPTLFSCEELAAVKVMNYDR